MDTGNILIGVISIFAIITPFVLMYRKSKKTERGLVKNLKEYTDKNGLQLDKWETVCHLALGIDNTNQVAYFVEVEDENYETRHVLLSEMSNCMVNRELREVSCHGEKDNVTHSLEICFYPKNRKGEMEVFKLYDEDKRKSLSGEIQLANDWVAKFNSIINSANVKSNASIENKMAIG